MTRVRDRANWALASATSLWATIARAISTSIWVCRASCLTVAFWLSNLGLTCGCVLSHTQTSARLVEFRLRHAYIEREVIGLHLE